MAETTTAEAPVETAPAATTLLDAPETTKEGAESTDTSLLDAKPELDAEGKPKVVEAEVKTEKPVVPEKYADFKLPEGQKLDPVLAEKAVTVFKELGLSQDAAQKLVDLQTENTATQIKQTMDVFTKQVSDWASETKKELGANPEQALSIASKGIDAIFKDPAENKQFREMMKDTGLGNWKLMVKAFSYVGKQISEDKLVQAKTAAPGEKKPTAEVLFDHPTSNHTK